MRCDDEDEMIERIKEIASIIENGTDLMTGFDDVMFESLVDKIVVKNREEFEFNLVGSLKFTERMSNVLCNQKNIAYFYCIW